MPTLVPNLQMFRPIREFSAQILTCTQKSQIKRKNAKLALSVSVSGKAAHVQAVAIDGGTLDEFDIESPIR